MKKILSAVILAAMIVLAGCGGSKEEAGAEVKPVTVGIAKFVTHPALDAIEQGIQDGLAQAGYADAVYDLQNANADGNTAASIASKFKADKVDLAVGIATPTAIALANGIKDIPVLYAAVTDPVSAGLVSSYDAGEGNVTGVSDMTPVKEQIELLASLVDLKKLGHIYSSSEANAVTLAEMARTACEELGIEFIESSVTNSAEVMQAAQALAGRVDGFYVSTDNTVVSALSSLVDVATRAGVPVMSADPSSAEETPVLAAWGFDYYAMGVETGKMAAKILGGASPESLPTLFMTDPSAVDLLINVDAAAALGITLPEGLVAGARTVVKDGAVIRQKG